MCNSSRLYLLTSFVVFILQVNCAPFDEYEGDTCRNSDSSSGICTKVSNCAVALKELSQHRIHNFHRCGFNGKNEIVCCPESNVKSGSSSTNAPPERSSTFDSGEIWTDESSTKKFTKTDKTSTTEASQTHNRDTFHRKCVQVCEEFSTQFRRISLDYHISGGEDADLGEFPHMAALGFQPDPNTNVIEWRCGATLISSRFLVTAAHCIFNADRLPPSKVRLGVIDISSSNQNTLQEFDVRNVTIYPNYNLVKRIHDIALIEISNDAIMNNYTQPACLYAEDDNPRGLIVTGWGKLAGGLSANNSIILQKAKLEPYDSKECSKIYEKRINRAVVASQICAFHNTSDTCGGDSGGPLQIQKVDNIYAIVGITSYGITTCGGDIPGIYTRISKYLDWIEPIVWPDN